MFKRALLLASLILAAFVFAACADDGSIVITTSKTSYPGYSGGYSGPGQTGATGPFNPLGSDQQSSDSLLMYQEYYDFNQGDQSATGPAQFNIYGSEPSYLIINGQSRPYDPSYVPSNSLWIQGKTSWTQYIKCPLNAWYKVLAVSNGGPATMVETYPTGFQQVKNYNFFSGYTPGVFEADSEGRHTLTFYINGQKSNSVIVDVVPYSGTTFVNNPPIGQPPAKGCDITGTWNFGTNGPYNIVKADGTIVAKQTLDGEIFDSGTWYVIDASKRQYGFSWQSGWKHTFALSADCSSLDGSGRYKGGEEELDHATRVTTGASSGSNSFSPPSGVLIDSADQGFDPNAHIGGVLTDSAEDMGYYPGSEEI